MWIASMSASLQYMKIRVYYRTHFKHIFTYIFQLASFPVASE